MTIKINSTSGTIENIPNKLIPSTPAQWGKFCAHYQLTQSPRTIAPNFFNPLTIDRFSTRVPSPSATHLGSPTSRAQLWLDVMADPLPPYRSKTDEEVFTRFFIWYKTRKSSLKQKASALFSHTHSRYGDRLLLSTNGVGHSYYATDHEITAGRNSLKDYNKHWSSPLAILSTSKNNFGGYSDVALIFEPVNINNHSILNPRPGFSQTFSKACLRYMGIGLGGMSPTQLLSFAQAFIFTPYQRSVILQEIAVRALNIHQDKTLQPEILTEEDLTFHEQFLHHFRYPHNTVDFWKPLPHLPFSAEEGSLMPYEDSEIFPEHALMNFYLDTPTLKAHGSWDSIMYNIHGPRYKRVTPKPR